MQQLHDELDFADATRPELEIGCQILACDFGVDQRLHLAQAGKGGVIQVSAIDEGPQGFEQMLASRNVARDRSRLDPGVAFPVAALALVVPFHRGKRQGHASGVAEWSQAQIDAEGVTVHRNFREQLDQHLAQAREIRLVRERTFAIARTVVREREDEVDVGGKIQLVAAELAHRDHDQALRHAIGIARHAVPARKRAFRVGERGAKTGFGQCAGSGQSLFDVIQSVDVAPDQAQRLGAAVATQRGHRVGLVQTRGQDQGPRVGVARIGKARERVCVQQVRIARKRIEREIAGEQHTLHVFGDAGIVMHQYAGRTAARQHLCIAGLHESVEIGTRGHGAIVSGGKTKTRRDCSRRATLPLIGIEP